ncbi:PadR family transcriptional regulator [Paenirhodobacter populi]|nr:PadR family transcriptional regulator [Sinirhodobacter populi]
MRHMHDKDHGRPHRPDHAPGEGRGDHLHPKGARRGRGPFDYGALRLFILALIADEPRHGYELMRIIEERTQGRYIPSPGVIYPTLAWLDDMGFVTTETEAGRKSHRITPEGMAFLAANRDRVDALLSRDWSSIEEDADPVRAGMQAVKSALVSALRHGDADAGARAEIAAILNTAAQAIRARAGTKED